MKTTRTILGFQFWDGLGSDMRYALRQLRRGPAFAAVVILSLAVGIASATTLFSVIYAVLINPFPYRDAERLMRLSAESRTGRSLVYLNSPQIEQLQGWAGQSNVVESVLAVDFHELTMTGQDLPENVHTIYPSLNTFDDLGVTALLGRVLGPADADEGSGPKPVAVLGHRFWQKRFQSDPQVLGKLIELDRKQYAIVGVMPSRFSWYEAEVYLPLRLTVDPGPLYLVNVRLKPGVSQEAANSALQPLLDRFAQDAPKQFSAPLRVQVSPYQLAGKDLRETLLILMGAVAALLAIGCGNVSILLLARGTTRLHELSIRIAIGAHRRRIIRQLLTESLILAALGVGFGIVVAYAMLAAIQAWSAPSFFGAEFTFWIHVPVLLLSGAVALSTGILFGLWPALKLSRVQSKTILPTINHGAGRVTRTSPRSGLLAAQIALTVVLLAAAASSISTFSELLRTPLGFDPHNVMSLGISISGCTYLSWEARAAYFERLRQGVAGEPGVVTAALADTVPPRSWRATRFEILGKDATDRQVVSFNPVSPQYFPTLRIPLIEGRIWDEGENRRSANVALINRTLAQRYFPNGNAVGQSIRIPEIASLPPAVLTVPNLAQLWVEIVGVVEDTKNNGLKNPIQPAVFVPNTLVVRQYTNILVRSDGPPRNVLRRLRESVASVNPEQQTFGGADVEPLDVSMLQLPEMKQARVAAWLLSVLGTLALSLAGVGLYSVVSYMVAQRTNEFGIRMALGAQRHDVLRIAFGSVVVSVVGGIAVGTVLTVFLNTIIARLAVIDSRNPISLAAGVALIIVVAGLACAIPAWRASRIDPMISIRSE